VEYRLTALGTSTAAINESDSTVVSVDAAAGSRVRNSVRNFSTGPPVPRRCRSKIRVSPVQTAVTP